MALCGGVAARRGARALSEQVHAGTSGFRSAARRGPCAVLLVEGIFIGFNLGRFFGERTCPDGDLLAAGG